jgi:hypothetical protein
MYTIMRYWDNDQFEWNTEEQAFAAAWRKQPKWVVSRTLKSVGHNATLISDDLEGAIRALKAERDGEIEVAGPHLQQPITSFATFISTGGMSMRSLPIGREELSTYLTGHP